MIPKYDPVELRQKAQLDLTNGSTVYFVPVEVLLAILDDLAEANQTADHAELDLMDARQNIAELESECRALSNLLEADDDGSSRDDLLS